MVTVEVGPTPRLPGGSPINPFSYPTPIGVYEALKMIIFTFTLVPVRAVLCLLLTLMVVFFSWLSVVGLSEERRKQPLGRYRRALQVPAMLCMRGIMFALGFYWINVRGKPAKGVNILAVAPHSSFCDAGFLFGSLWPAAVAKRDVLNYPFVSSIVKSTQTMLVDRADVNSKHDLIAEFKRRADDPSWGRLAIFPEGTTTNREALISFKLGAFIPGKPVQPVTIEYPSYFFDPANLFTGPGIALWFWRLSCQVVNFMTITYLDVYEPNDEEKQDARLFAVNVRRVMARSLHVPATEHTYEDCKLQMEARKLSLPPDRAVVEFGRMGQLYNYTLDDIQREMRKFAKTDINHDGGMSLEEFAKYLNLPASPAVEMTFEMFDTDRNGEIDLREFLVGLALLNGLSSREDIFEYAFKLFARDGEDHINMDTFVRLLTMVFPTMPDSQAKELFEAADADNTGVLTFENFALFGETHPEYVQVFLAWRGDDWTGSAPKSSTEQPSDEEDTD